ncbi:hypothetical protein [Micromonospora okii]|uniref:hypothetical protein n=1 Tax=Micromonospora okii TaxID=1182970 RepID=UPI001E3287EC|nr:hypothetical protein [Micromonospora okii]
MSPRPGGETDKFGNRYEGAWTVRHVLRVLSGAGTSITVEDIDEFAEGAEFTFSDGRSIQVHQVKRQNRNANSWTPKSLQEKGIWENARKHVSAGRRFHFVSIIPARPIQELADRARRSYDLDSFTKNFLSDELKESFDQLASTDIFGSPEVAWSILRGFWIEWHDERGLNDINAVIADMLLEGAAGRLAAVGLGDLVQQNLGVRLDAATIEAGLSEYGLRRAQQVRTATIAEHANAITAGWIAGIERELIKPVIPRSEAARLVELLEGEDQLLLLTGDAGYGKSAVLHELAGELTTKDVAVLGFRLDRLEAFASTAELGEKLGLTVSPVTALSVVAGQRPSVLVIDQLDAISLASGRMPRSFDAIANTIREAAAFPTMRIVLACRKFDVENDHRIRELVTGERSARVELGKLSESQVTEAVDKMGLDPASLDQRQVDLLRSPLHLVLLQSIADQTGALSFQTPNGLFDAFWDRKVIACSHRREGTRFAQVARTVASAMSSRQRLWIDVSTLDQDDLTVDAGVLVSEHVLVRDGQRIAFFHEAFFGYVFTRAWISQRQSIVEFLLAGEQELFRRSQVRQILSHLRASEPERFVEEVEGLLMNEQVRFHIKEVVLGIVRSLSEPSSADWDMMNRVLDANPPFESRMWLSLRTLPWFDRLDADGMFEEWLASGDERIQNNALHVALGGMKERPERMAELLAPHVGRERYANWLLWTVRFANAHESRPLFDLLVDAIRTGKLQDYGHDLWMFTYDLAEHQPAWAAELLVAHLALRPSALAVDESGKVALLLDRDDALIRLTTGAAKGAPQVFCELIIPYLLSVMRLTERPWAEHLLADAHFGYRVPHNSFHELEDAVLFGAASAIRSFAGNDPAAAQSLLEKLAADRHEAAQWLLYEGLRGAAASHYADWAGSLLLEGSTRFLSGYMSNGVWTTRQLIEAITPHLSPELFSRLERKVLALRFSWEKRNPGWYVFCLLSAMGESRLSLLGRRRLGELRRLTGMDSPEEPEPIVVRQVESPIAPDAAQYMSDEDWLRAMARHNSDRESFTTFRGGSRELSHVLQGEVAKDPVRFARLALRLDGSINPDYTEAILMGLGEGDPLPDPNPVFVAIRHIASLHLGQNDRWLGWPLRKNYLKSDVPADIITMLIERIMSSEDPVADRWPNHELGERESLDGVIMSEGMNTARGSLALTLGYLLVYDSDGRRTALVVPVLDRLAQDQSVAVRACVAQVIAGCLMHARPQAVEAFKLLVQGDDRLLVVETVTRLIRYIGNADHAIVMPLVPRMLAAEAAEVRQCGGALAALASVQWGQEDLLPAVVSGQDAAARTGAAMVCAHLLPVATNSAVAEDTLIHLMSDSDKGVREAAAEVAGVLRNERLRRFSRVLTALISSEAYSEAVPQLLITLERAPDRVDALVILCARRFTEVHGADIGDISTGAAGDAREVGQLVFRAYAQATSHGQRCEALDLIDQLLALNAYGMVELVDAAER